MTYRPPPGRAIPIPIPISTSLPTSTTTTPPTTTTTTTTAPGPPPPPPPPPPLPPSETRTLLTFPTEGLSSPRILRQAALRSFPVRYPPGSALPAQTQINRWLCCRCAEEGYLDPVGMVHCSSSTSSSSAAAASSSGGRGEGAGAGGCYSGFHGGGVGSGGGSGGGSGDSPGFGPFGGRAAGAGDGVGVGVVGMGSSPGNTGTSEDGSSSHGYGYETCWRPTCRHAKCVNCALYAGPLIGGSISKDPGRGAKLLIRTVGGLYASPRFVDPVYWECAGCGEWVRNRFDSRCTLGVTACWAEGGCVFAWRAAGRAQLGFGIGVPLDRGDGGGGAGVLTAESVVMNRYGQRLGTADQRVAVANGPWDWQRRALGDPRCAVVVGLRAAMKRSGEAMQFDSSVDRSRRSTDLARLWDEGSRCPSIPYRRPPPVDENDVEENNEYEGSYLLGIRAEPLDKGKGVEQTASRSSPRFCSTPSPVVLSSVAVNPASFFSGWNHLQM